MSDLGNKKIMSKNIQYYMDRKGVDRNKMSDDLDFKYTTLTDWIKGNTYPRIDKIELMANYFGIQKSDLVEDREQSRNEPVDLIAAHIDDDTPADEREQIINFIENLKKARSNGDD